MSGLSFADLLDLLGHTDGDFASVCHQPVGGKFSSQVVPSGQAPKIVPDSGDCWFSVNPLTDPATWSDRGRGTAANVVRLAAVYADLDLKPTGIRSSEAAGDLVNELSGMLGTRPSAVVLSGHGWQPYWPLDDGPSGPEARALLRRWGRFVAHIAQVQQGGQVDMVYDLARVLRVPGTMNCKNDPVPVIGIRDRGRALSVAELDEVLTMYGCIELVGDRDEPGRFAVSPATDWQWAPQTCHYTVGMIDGWRDDEPAARHPWLVAQATRIAAGHRYGCYDEAGYHGTVGVLVNRFRDLLGRGGEARKEVPGEIADALAWGQGLAAAKNDLQITAELGSHSHEELSDITFSSPVSASQSTPLRIVPGGAEPPVLGSAAVELAQEGSDLPARMSVTLTDRGNAQLLVNRYGDRLRYALNRGWLAWDGNRWRRTSDDSEAVQAAVETINAIEDASDPKLRQHRVRSLSRRALEAMVALARRDEAIGVEADALDADPYVLCTPGGLVNLRTGALGPNLPEHLNTKATCCAPSRETPVRWLAFLAETLQGDPDLIGYVQRLAGYSATGLSDQHLLPFLHGAGGNGKGVFIEVLMGVLGDYATTAPAGFLMAGRDRHETEVARLHGCRLVVCSEINQEDRFDEAKVKLLTGGDRLTARFMNQNHFSFDPTHTLWLMGNHQPRISAGGESFWRRLRLLPFTHEVPDEKKIPGLGKQFVEAEGPAILGWLIEGARAALTEGLQTPASVLAATEVYAQEEDALARFVADRCLIGGGPSVRVATADMRHAYEQWCREEGEQAVNQQVFGRELRRRCAVGDVRSNGRRFYTNISLLAAPDDDDDLTLQPQLEPEEWWKK